MPFNPSALAQAASTAGYDEPPPPGYEYESQLYEAEMFESKSGDEFLRLRWRVLSGQMRDHEWSHVQSLEELDRRGEPNGALVVTARVLAALGVDVEHVQTRSDLRRELDHCLNAAYAVEVKRNGQYVNTMPLRRLDAVQETMQPPPTTSNGTQYGQQGRAPTNAIYGDDAPPRDERSMTLSTEDVRREPERTGESELGDGSDFTQREPIKKGDIDPETGEPIPF